MASGLDLCTEGSPRTGGGLCVLSHGELLKILNRAVTTVCRYLGRFLWQHWVGCYKNGEGDMEERDISRNDNQLNMSDKGREKLSQKLIFQAYINIQKEVRERAGLGGSIMNSLSDIGVQFDGLCYKQHATGSH